MNFIFFCSHTSFIHRSTLNRHFGLRNFNSVYNFHDTFFIWVCWHHSTLWKCFWCWNMDFSKFGLWKVKLFFCVFHGTFYNGLYQWKFTLWIDTGSESTSLSYFWFQCPSKSEIIYFSYFEFVQIYMTFAWINSITPECATECFVFITFGRFWRHFDGYHFIQHMPYNWLHNI